MTNTIRNTAIMAALIIGTCGWIPAQPQTSDTVPDRAVVPLSNPSQPAKITVSVMRGSITVKAYDGKEIIVEARTREKALFDDYGEGRYGHPPLPPAPPAPPIPAAAAAKAARAEHLAEQEAQAKIILEKNLQFDEQRKAEKERRADREKKNAGMKLISQSTSGLLIEEDKNVVRVNTHSWKTASDLVIQVPASSSIEIRSMMDGAVAVEGVSGEVDINNINGPVTVKNVSGNVLVHTINGDIEVSLARVSADKPLSFSTMQGDIDITLPAAVKAALKMKTEQGEIYTDFDIQMTQRTARSETPERTDQGKFRIAFDRALIGTINGGGPELAFQTFSGNIYIRKGK